MRIMVQLLKTSRLCDFAVNGFDEAIKCLCDYENKQRTP